MFLPGFNALHEISKPEFNLFASIPNTYVLYMYDINILPSSYSSSYAFFGLHTVELLTGI